MLHLKTGTPRLGLTRNTGFTSLHGHHIDSVNAPPEGSSDDEAPEDFEFGRTENKEKPSGYGLPRKGTDSTLASHEDGKKSELSNEASNIRTTSFTSGKGAGKGNGSQSSQKRNNLDSDDDLPFHYSQSQNKRSRLSFGYGGMNRHKGTKESATKPGDRAKGPPKESGKAGHSFVTPRSEDMIAELDKSEAKAKEFKPPDTTNLSSLQKSQRDQRASQRSTKGTQESSQGSTRAFKQPPRPPPKRVPQSRKGAVISEDCVSSEATRLLKPPKKSRMLTEDNALRPSELQNAFSTATDKLGVSKMYKNPPAPPTCDSSPTPTPLDTATTVSSPLTSLGDSSPGISVEDVPILTSKDIKISSADPSAAVCPICQQPVDKSYLEGFGTHMKVKLQTVFCRAHKKRSAESEWTERGYPEIDWEQLDARIGKLHRSIDEILSGRNRSFYRNAFEDLLKSGKYRSLQGSLMRDEIEGTLTGYYGGRGAKVMADNIMARFASKLRRLAASDKLISSGGVSRYVQAVLVPELAVLLIREDMGLDDEEKAREVLRESVEIGNLLNEEEDETITESDTPTAKEPDLVDLT